MSSSDNHITPADLARWDQHRAEANSGLNLLVNEYRSHRDASGHGSDCAIADLVAEATDVNNAQRLAMLLGVAVARIGDLVPRIPDVLPPLPGAWDVIVRRPEWWDGRREMLPPDLTPNLGDGVAWCAAQYDLVDLRCTRRMGHRGRHAAGDGTTITGVWP